MKSLLKTVSYISLGVTIIPSFLVFAGKISLDQGKWIMLLGTIIWFITAPFWINKKQGAEG